MLEVWDEDALIDDFMGQFLILVETIFGLSPDGEWRAIEGVETVFEVALGIY